MLKLKKITPVFNHIITTNDVYENDVYDNNILVKTKGSMKEYQKVVAVGPTVKTCSPGDVIMINPVRYAVKKHQDGSLKDGVVSDNPDIAFNIPVVSIDGKEHLLLFDTDVYFVINEYEETEDLPPLYVAQPTILQ